MKGPAGLPLLYQAEDLFPTRGKRNAPLPASCTDLGSTGTPNPLVASRQVHLETPCLRKKLDRRCGGGEWRSPSCS